MFEYSFYIEETNTIYNGLFLTEAEAIAEVKKLKKDHPAGEGSVTNWKTYPASIVYQTRSKDDEN